MENSKNPACFEAVKGLSVVSEYKFLVLCALVLLLSMSDRNNNAYCQTNFQYPTFNGTSISSTLKTYMTTMM
jgi:hypothetical protein